MKTCQDWIAAKTKEIVDAGVIPMRRVGLCWDFTKPPPPAVMPAATIDMQVVDLGEAAAHGLMETAGSTGGALHHDWGRNPRSTPLGKFAEMAFDGTLPRGQQLDRLLRQFAKIEGCEWALHMLAALRMGDFVQDDDSELSV